MYGFIYLTTNIINGKKYIGMCKNTHRKNYIGSGKILKQSIKKYGKENFNRIILEECDTLKHLGDREKYWIEYYNAVSDEQFYNLAPGGYGGNSVYMKEYWSKMNVSERKKSRNWSKRVMIGTNNPMYGKKHSLTTKKLIGSKSVNRNWAKHDHRGKNNPRAKRILVDFGLESKFYDCLKDFYDEYKIIPYPTLKSMAQNGNYSKKYGLKITYEII